MSVLIDTHILLYWFGDKSVLTARQVSTLDGTDADNPLTVSDISLWEVATLFSLGQIKLDRPLRDWLERAIAPPLVRRVGISPAIAAELAVLPDSFHRDPADRILVATARVLGLPLITNDARIRDADLVETI